jgi:phosphoglycolate phosphatase
VKEAEIIIIFDLEGTLYYRHQENLPEIKEMIESLANDGIRMAICTMAGDSSARNVLKECGILQYFDVIYSYIPKLSKTDLLRNLLSEMELEGSKCLMVGDSGGDMAAARNNNVPFIGVAYGFGSEDIINAEVIAQDVQQLKTEIYKFLQKNKL